MIHVDEQPEPAGFDEKVRQRGRAHLEQEGIALDEPLPVHADIRPFWRACLDGLYRSYQGTCAYLAVHFERATGGASVDHFIAKSKKAGLAYEWRNYRLACTMMNSPKREYADVLDPFDVENGWFRLELVSGRIYPAPDLPDPLKAQAMATIERLGLDKPRNRNLRAKYFREFTKSSYNEAYFRELSPFLWFEAQRQGLL